MMAFVVKGTLLGCGVLGLTGLAVETQSFPKVELESHWFLGLEALHHA